MIIIGSARISENGSINGTAGDQKQGASPDYSGEVSMQEFYAHSLGWIVIRWKDAEQAQKAAKLMIEACNNANLGYSQKDRYGVLKHGVGSTVPTNCDCTSLVREIIKEVSGKDPGEFYTGSARGVLQRTGLFEDQFRFIDGEETPVKTGDILVTASAGHMVMVVDDGQKQQAQEQFVLCDGLNLREEPSMNGEIICVIPRAEKVTKYSACGGWARVSWCGAIGYCGEQYLADNMPQMKGRTARNTTIYYEDFLPVGEEFLLTGAEDGERKQVDYNGHIGWIYKNAIE